MLPDAALRPLLAAGRPARRARPGVGGAVRRARCWSRSACVDGFAVLVDEEPVGPDHDLDDEERWWDGLDAPPARLVAVRDLDLVDDDAWPAALALLAAEPGHPGRAAPRPARYTAWWLARHARLGGRRPAHWRLPSADRLAALYDPVPGDRPSDERRSLRRDRGARRPAPSPTPRRPPTCCPAGRPGPARRTSRWSRAAHAALADAVAAGRVRPPTTWTRPSGSGPWTAPWSTSTSRWCSTRRGSAAVLPRGRAGGRRRPGRAGRPARPAAGPEVVAAEVRRARAGRSRWADARRGRRWPATRSGSPVPDGRLCAARRAVGAAAPPGSGPVPGPGLARRRRPLARRATRCAPCSGLLADRRGPAEPVRSRATQSRDRRPATAPRATPPGLPAVRAHLAAGAARHRRRRRHERLHRGDRHPDGPARRRRSRSSPGPPPRTSRRSPSWRPGCWCGTSPPARSRASARTTCPASCARSPPGCCAPRPATSPATTTSCTRTTGCPGRSAGWPGTAGGCRWCTARTPWPGSRTPRSPTATPRSRWCG